VTMLGPPNPPRRDAPIRLTLPISLRGADANRSVAQIVKNRAEVAGFDPTLFSGHSLRAGFVTSALHHGADILRVMDVTRHREMSTLKTYDRRAKAFKQHAGEAFL
jgi:site-specific recombinase XerD